MPGARSQDPDSLPAVRLNPFKRQAYANAKQPGPQPAKTTFCITRIAGQVQGKKQGHKVQDPLVLFRSFSSFAGDATQHGEVRVGRIQQTLKHGQSHGVNVANSYLPDEMERTAPEMEMD